MKKTVNKQITLKIKNMNKQDRKELERALELIEESKLIVENIRDTEQEKFDNLSEGLQQTERGQKFEETASSLEDVISQLEEAMDGINTVSE